MSSFYRTPSKHGKDSVDQILELGKTLDHIYTTLGGDKCTVIIGGDFNAPHIDWENHSILSNAPNKKMCEELLNTLSEHELHQLQHKPTRYSSVLDLFCLNKPDLVKDISIIPGFSDHDMVVVDTHLSLNINRKIPRKINQWSKADWDKIKSDTVNYQEEFIKDAESRTVDQNYKAFQDFIMSIINKYVPQKLSSTRRNVPWLTTAIKRLCKKKQRLYNKARKRHSPRIWDSFKSCQRSCVAALKIARWDYISNILSNTLETGNSKPFWRYVKSRKQDKCGVSPLKSNGTLHTDSSSKATILNNQFSSVFTCDDHNGDTVLEGPSIPPLPELVIHEEGVSKLLSNIDHTKAGGPDDIPCRILKELSDELAPYLTCIFRQSLAEGVLPDIWKSANVTPIFKKGSTCAAENYRPVSLTCIPCKLLEHILCSHIRGHLDKHGALSPLNHGFRKRHSCESQLIVTVQDLINRKDKPGSQIDIGVLDFAKAFDKVPHTRLMSKLRLYGIQGEVAAWIYSFLSHRTQKVVVDGSISESADVISGVPQGTVMGPLLFLLFINDLPQVVDPSTQVRLFADDCLIYRTITSIQDQIQLQKDLDALQLWGDLWGMSFNASKCNILTVTNKEDPLVKFYELNNTVLEHVDSATYLGILIHKSLRFSEHINKTANKCSSRLGFLRRNLKKCPQQLKQIAYYSLVRSTAEYSATVWDPFTNKDTYALERIQNRAVRWVCGVSPKQQVSITALRKDLKWPTLEDRRRNQRLAFMYKVCNGQVAVTPEHLGLERTVRTRKNHRHKFRELGWKTVEKKNSYTNRTVPEWNGLPAAVAEADSLDIFKSQLSAYLV